MTWKPIILALVVALSLGLTVGASGDTVTYSGLPGMDVPMTVGNWGTTLHPVTVSIPKFDPLHPNPYIPGSAPGTLLSISFSLTGDLGDQSYYEGENKSSSPDPVQMQLSEKLTLQRPDGSTIVVSIPLLTDSPTLGASDDPIVGGQVQTDWAGTDYYKYTGHSATQTVTAPPPALLAGDLALFTGTGDIPLPVTARANSSWSGNAYDNSRKQTYADAKVAVTYEYYTPEPGSLALLGLGLPLAGVWFRRRRRQV